MILLYNLRPDRSAKSVLIVFDVRVVIKAVGNLRHVNVEFRDMQKISTISLEICGSVYGTSKRAAQTKRQTSDVFFYGRSSDMVSNSKRSRRSSGVKTDMGDGRQNNQDSQTTFLDRGNFISNQIVGAAFFSTFILTATHGDPFVRGSSQEEYGTNHEEVEEQMFLVPSSQIQALKSSS